jgi:curli biogenesis system outer membrane secretion channel CsgG
MMKSNRIPGAARLLAWLAPVLGLALAGCGAGPRVQRTEAAPQATRAAGELDYSQYRLAGPKRRVAIASFTDKTGYGSNLFGRADDLGKQAADMLASHLIKTGQFILLERENLGALLDEQKLQGATPEELGQGFIGVNALIFGAVTEFGVKTTGSEGVFSKSRVQTAHCKVTVRLVDPRTGQAWYSAFGEANAENEINEVMGFGGRASYDATLADKALNAAIVKLLGNVINELGNQPWRGAILDLQEGQVFVNAGARIGLRVGDILVAERPGKLVRNPQTGGMVQLPGREVARLRVDSQFGSSELDEGSVCSLVQGGPVEKADVIKLAPAGGTP